jgi:protein-tyrosine phosphatase
VTPEVAVVGISRLDDHVLLADAALAMGMVTAGAQRLVDLRGETKPPGLPIPIDHFPIMDLEGGQEELILQAARHVAAQAHDGIVTGVYCQAGISRTSTVAIAYLMVRGQSLDAASRRVRAIRPQAMPALELWRSLEQIEGQQPGQR